MCPNISLVVPSRDPIGGPAKGRASSLTTVMVDRPLTGVVMTVLPLIFTSWWTLKFMQLLLWNSYMFSWPAIVTCSSRCLRQPRVVEQERRGDISACGWLRRCKVYRGPDPIVLQPLDLLLPPVLGTLLSI